MEAFALNCAALLSALCVQAGQLHQHATAAITIAETHEFLGMIKMAKISLGWAQTQNGHREEAIQQMQQSMTAYQIGGGTAFRAIHLALYADACGGIGNAEAGLAAVDDALALAQRTGGRYYDAELYRIKGELILQKFSVISSQLSVTNPQHLTPSTQAEVEQEAEECFQKAIEIAQKQQAKSLELRATVSLARLWQQQGKITEAHRMVSEVYNWFTEGFDTKDLQEAKALLEELSH
jgi:predicted ATPase